MKKTFTLMALLAFLAALLIGTSQAANPIFTNAQPDKKPPASEDISLLIRQVAANRDFFSKFAGYSSYKLHEVTRLDKEKIRLVLFDSTQITYTFVFNVKTMRPTYSEPKILPKNVREDKFLRSIKVTEAVEIARKSESVPAASNNQSAAVKQNAPGMNRGNAVLDDIPLLIRQVAANRDFFSRFAGYSSYKLHEVKRINKEEIGLILFDSAHITYTFVFNVKTVRPIYLESKILPKNVREDKFLRSIKVADAVEIARKVNDEAELLERLTREGRKN